jgi:hypothetical protein
MFMLKYSCHGVVSSTPEVSGGAWRAMPADWRLARSLLLYCLTHHHVRTFIIACCAP